MMKLALLTTTLLLVSVISGEILSGQLQTNDNWYLLDKFCLTEEDSTFIVNVDFSKTPNASLLLYSDLSTNWGTIESYPYSSCYTRLRSVSTTININTPELMGKSLDVGQKRDRWWYLVFANCGSNDGSDFIIDIPSYSIIMKNGGDSFNSIISADQQNIPHAQIFFIIFFFILLVVTMINIVFLVQRNLESKVMKLFSVVLLFKILALFVCLTYWAYFFHQGYGMDAINLAGNTIDLVSRSFFILLLLLVAQGWTISPYYGGMGTKVIAAGVFFVILILSICIYLIPNVTTMPTRMYIFFYDTIPGYALMAFFLAIMIYFMVLSRSTYIKQVDHIKKKFFLFFGVTFTFWFLMLPISVALSHFLETWVRQKTVVIFNLCVDSIFFLIITVLFRASKTNPYVHILNLDQQEKGVRLDDKGYQGEASA
ncbi:hypothetical protein SAMD00019534_045490 [Acytostelium subglobosum LB1]|uniref:hypothetical protein n=1 Tax=Acytostelium subglobosum LB1 TaxID=1410327 RepID=UPI0006449A31|nr:hypothetical protein SAMD00019534_045490 [Acytostelium subglobosum LB1]GAM21374.1 hypothetical protein SAMD00019534_045490 [Acytostelium subglobosum LB1]|eukprot:XP_012755493.1 hypothetical protein SAMD00019534_045490 [Acytostelium subglobosum LB1]